MSVDLSALSQPVPPLLALRFRLEKCPACRRRPELVVAKGQDLFVPLDAGSDDGVIVPRYEIFPCCHARFVVRNDHISKWMQRRIKALQNKPVSGTSTKVL